MIKNARSEGEMIFHEISELFNKFFSAQVNLFWVVWENKSAHRANHLHVLFSEHTQLLLLLLNWSDGGRETNISRQLSILNIFNKVKSSQQPASRAEVNVVISMRDQWDTRIENIEMVGRILTPELSQLLLTESSPVGIKYLKITSSLFLQFLFWKCLSLCRSHVKAVDISNFEFYWDFVMKKWRN